MARRGRTAGRPAFGAVNTATPDAEGASPPRTVDQESVHASYARGLAAGAPPPAYGGRRGGVGLGVVACAGARRGSPRGGGAGGDQPREREGVVGQLAQSAPRRARARPAARPRLACLAGRQRRRAPRSVAGPGVAAARLRQVAASAARRPKTKHSPASSTRAGWRRAGRCRRTRRRRRGPAGSSGRRGRWRPRPSCSGRRARPARGSCAGSMPASRERRAMFGKRPGRRSRMSSPTAARRCAAARSSIASATWSRGASSSTKRSPSASSSVAPSPRTASVIRKPSRARGPQGGGVELHELEVGELARRPPRRGPGRRRTPPAGWSCAPRARPCRRWRGSWPARARRIGAIARRASADAAPLVRPQRRRAAAGSSTWMRSSSAAAPRARG